MKLFLVIIIAKLTYFIGKLFNRGSSIPGQIALKLYPNILNKLNYTKNIIAVTGSNGKTSTSGMIYEVLRGAGKKVGYNFEGSNQIEGITTLLLRLSNPFGKVDADYIIIEVDEQYTKHVFKYITPKYLLVTNLYRDQLTRNGHPENIYNIIKKAIPEETTLLLNTDDPLSSLLGFEKENTIYYGINENKNSKKDFEGKYNDYYYCPNCSNKLNYTYYHYNHIGGYICKDCGHSKKDAKYKITKLNLNQGSFVINNKYSLSTKLNSYYNIYNLLSAFAITSVLGIDTETICSELNNYTLKNGRVVTFKIGEHEGTLLLSKHENSISYNQSLEYIKNKEGEKTVVVLIDAVSRKYYTSEISWIWDIYFEKLNDDAIKKIILVGKYAYDLAYRFSVTEIDSSKIIVETNLDNMMNVLKTESIGDIYTVTCFSDKQKFLDRTLKG